MHRTDPAYLIIAVGFAIVILMVILHRLRSSLSPERLKSGLSTETYVDEPDRHDHDDDSERL
ncbi:hypothetical protein [Alicyclobacillus mengziensis]|uniref:Uncharacterized protein n=1 Tax=Alicyclobacillus mengziensis TaxID=2931921 RepID=A0A9X7VWL2_9BACL|nr:hypothetical protein [Alicyclobacillus mengziensis]QSO46180.1 hypothetical protein JZ786_16915 [Alicyclobacillus mengziensis]